MFSPSLSETEEIRAVMKEKRLLVDTAETFMDYANELLSENNSSRTWNTPRHRGLLLVKALAQNQLFELFWTTCKQLTDDAYFATEGSCGRLIVGARGMGKSRAARTFIGLIEAINPQVIPVYVDFKRLSDSPLAKNSLLGVLVEYLNEVRACEIREKGKFEDPATPLFQRLKEMDKYLFLIVDELDFLYRKTLRELPHGHTILDDLVSFGTTKSGRMATLLCGSSLALSELIQGNAVLEQSYPLVYGATDLNFSKFRLKRIPPGLPTDVHTVHLFVKQHVPDATMEQSRCVAFVAGSTARYVEYCLVHVDGESLFEADLEHDGFKDEDAEALYENIMDRLCVKKANVGFLNALVAADSHGSGELVSIIANTAWEADFEALDDTEVMQLWKDLQAERTELVKHTLKECLLHLSDRSRIVLDDARGGEQDVPKRIFPVTMFSLFKHRMERKKMGN